METINTANTLHGNTRVHVHIHVHATKLGDNVVGYRPTTLGSFLV